MEFLLVNHPLDCPICDQGGECDLQVSIVRLMSLAVAPAEVIWLFPSSLSPVCIRSVLPVLVGCGMYIGLFFPNCPLKWLHHHCFFQCQHA